MSALDLWTSASLITSTQVSVAECPVVNSRANPWLSMPGQKLCPRGLVAF